MRRKGVSVAETKAQHVCVCVCVEITEKVKVIIFNIWMNDAIRECFPLFGR